MAVVGPSRMTFSIAKKNPLKGLTLYPSGFLTGFADGSVRLLPATIDSKILKALLTRNGGEDVLGKY